MAKRRKRQGNGAGIGVDAFGGRVVDPTENVKALAAASSARQDDLRQLNNRYIRSEIKRVRMQAFHVKEIVSLHQVHDYALHKAEAGRLNALRKNDREDLRVLAAATTAKAEALQVQVAASAKALADTFAAQMSDVIKRLSALELSSSEGKGKATVESPMMTEMVSELKALRREQQNVSGQKQGALSTREMISWVLLTLITLYALYKSIKPG